LNPVSGWPVLQTYLPADRFSLDDCDLSFCLWLRIILSPAFDDIAAFLETLQYGIQIGSIRHSRSDSIPDFLRRHSRRSLFKYRTNGFSLVGFRKRQGMHARCFWRGCRSYWRCSSLLRHFPAIQRLPRVEFLHDGVELGLHDLHALLRFLKTLLCCFESVFQIFKMIHIGQSSRWQDKAIRSSVISSSE